MKTALKCYLFFSQSSLSTCSILDFIIYFRAPTVSLLSETCNGSGLKAIANFRRGRRKALRCRSQPPKGENFPETSGGGSSKVPFCLGAISGPLSSKEGSKHFCTKTTHSHKARSFLSMWISRNAPAIISNIWIMLEQSLPALGSSSALQALGPGPRAAHGGWRSMQTVL